MPKKTKTKSRRVPSDSSFMRMLKNMSSLKGSPLYDPNDNRNLLKEMSPEKSPLYKPRKKSLKQRRTKGTAF